MKVYEINNFDDLHSHFKSLVKNNRIVFRGQSNSDWKLIPKIGRDFYPSKISSGRDEKIIFESWQRYATHFITKEPQSIFDWLALAQHHNLATRLLDWTKNPLVATFFAVEQRFENDGAIFYFDIYNKDLAKNEDDPFTIKKFRVYFPKGFSPRIVQQRGVFTVSPSPHLPLEEKIEDRISKIIISKNAKKNIQEILEFYGVNRISIFQDLDNMSEMLNNYILKRFPSISKTVIENSPFG